MTFIANLRVAFAAIRAQWTDEVAALTTAQVVLLTGWTGCFAIVSTVWALFNVLKVTG